MPNTDVAVIGSGPAGLAASLEVAAAGARVVLIDENLRMGGQFFKQVPSSFRVEDTSALDKDYSLGQRFLRSVSEGKIDVWLDSLVWGAFGWRTLAVRRGQDMVLLNAEKVIVTTGAYDRPLPFPGWTLPGVITAGAAQTMAKSQWVMPGSRVLLVGTGPFQMPVARHLIHGGAKIVAVVEGSRFRSILKDSVDAMGRIDRVFEGFDYWREITGTGAPYLFGHTIIEAMGDEEVRGARIAAIDDEWRIKSGSERTVEVDTICTAFGFLPSTQLTQLLGCSERYDPLAGGFLPQFNDDLETTVPGVFVAGETSGIGGSDVAMAEGQLAGMVSVRQLGRLDHDASDDKGAAIKSKVGKTRRFARYLNTHFAPKPAAFQRIPDDTVVCRCEEVTAGEIRRAVLQGADTIKSVKILTRAGMGLCQGRICNSVVAMLTSFASGQPVEALGNPSFRPPIKPIRLGDLVPRA